MSIFPPRLRDAVHRFAQRRSFPAIVAATAFTDYFLPGSPSNTLLATAVMSNTRRWFVLGLSFALGCATGAMVLGLLLAAVGAPLVEWIKTSEAGTLWLRIDGMVTDFGLFALAALALTPFPVRIAVALLALSGFSPFVLGAIVLAGRVPIYLLIAWLAARAPELLAHIRARFPRGSEQDKNKERTRTCN